MKKLLRVAALVGVLCLGSSLSARPFTVDDMLRAESFGDMMLDPGGRWLVYSVQRPLVEAPRFDRDAMTVIRNRLFVTDLRTPQRGTPLDPLDLQSGMIPVGFSPAGKQLAVGRFDGQRWQLGIVTMATGAIRWTDISPDYESGAPTLNWVSEDQIVAITEPQGRLPFSLNVNSGLFRALEGEWIKAQSGRAPSVTVVGSGAHLGSTPHVADRQLALIDATTGVAHILETGDLRSLTLSPDHRIAAVSEQTEAVPLAADQPLHISTPTRRHRLILVDLATGKRTEPCADCDIRTSDPVWRPDSAAILFAGQRDSDPAGNGSMWTFDIANSRFGSLSIKSLIPVGFGEGDGEFNPAFAWADLTPIVFASVTHSVGGRADWYAVSGDTPVCVTCTLAAVSANLLQTDHKRPVMAVARGVWRLGVSGPVLIARDRSGMEEVPPFGSRDGRSSLLIWSRHLHSLTATIGDSGGQRLRVAAPKGVTVTTASGSARVVIVNRTEPNGVDQLLALRPGYTPVVVASLNDFLSSVEVADTVPLSSRLSDGRSVTDWLFLPPKRSLGGKLPMVVIPYPGRPQQSDAPPPAPPGQLATNVRVLVGHGYAVLLPGEPAVLGPSGGHYPFAVDILSAVDAAIAYGSVDSDRIGLYGHSFGGFTVATLATQTDRFKAIVASAGIYDVVSQRGTFAPWTRLRPGEGQSIGVEGGWAETGQPWLALSPWDDPAAYVAASAVFHADKIHTPILIQSADADVSALQQGEELFSSLYRQDKDAELLSYWGEGHVLTSPANVTDFYRRIFNWFDCHFDSAMHDCAVTVPSH